MRPPRLYSVWFDVGTEFPTTGDWRRMAAVLEATARQHAPGWTVDVERATPDTSIRPAIYERGITVNARKMRMWYDAVENAQEGDRLLLLDGDTFVTGSLDPLWEESFDVAITKREGTRLPLNGGVIAVRVNERSLKWFDLLWQTHERMIADAAFHRPWRRTHAGINQAALGYVLSQSPVCDLLQLRCVEWNCEDSSWKRFGPHTRIVHVKSALRKAVFSGSPAPRTGRMLPINRLAEMWHEIETRTLEAA